MTYGAIFHEFPGLENGLAKFHDQGAPCQILHELSSTKTCYKMWL